MQPQDEQELLVILLLGEDAEEMNEWEMYGIAEVPTDGEAHGSDEDRE